MVEHHALSKVEVLKLGYNYVGVEGLVAISAALRQGCLPRLKELYLNHVTDSRNEQEDDDKKEEDPRGLQAMIDAVIEGHAPILRYLDLKDNCPNRRVLVLLLPSLASSKEKRRGLAVKIEEIEDFNDPDKVLDNGEGGSSDEEEENGSGE